MTVEKINQKGNEVRLFSKSKYYYVGNQWVRYVEKLVNGQPKKTNKVMCKKELTDIFNEIQSVWDAKGQLIASRKCKADKLSWHCDISESESSSEITQFLRPVSLVVRKLTPTEKVSLKSMLARDKVTYCEFEDTKGITRIKTSPKGYRLISLIV